MLIDWFTVIAQIVNFLVLIWLLKRYLYKPVLDAIASREKSITDQVAAAAATQASSKTALDDTVAKGVAIDQQKATILAQAKTDADQERQKLIVQARKEYDDARTQQQASLDKERVEVSREIVQLTCKQVFSIARKTLADLSTTSLEQNMADVLVQRMGVLSPDDKTHISVALKADTEPAIVRSTFDLPKLQQDVIQTAINSTFSCSSHIDFETAPDLVCGIELVASSYKVSWSIADYLNGLESTTAELQRTKDAA